jgi:hypothetical protein
MTEPGQQLRRCSMSHIAMVADNVSPRRSGFPSVSG